MTMPLKVLWVEDGARHDYRHYLVPVYLESKIHLQTVEDATQAVSMLRSTKYDALILDVRIFPGQDPFWVEKFRHASNDKAEAQLGIELMHFMLDGAKSGIPTGWINLSSVAFFTVEDWSYVQQKLRIQIDEKQYERKRIDSPDDILLQLIKRVIGNK
jgi:hypothetical protein